MQAQRLSLLLSAMAALCLPSWSQVPTPGELSTTPAAALKAPPLPGALNGKPTPEAQAQAPAENNQPQTVVSTPLGKAQSQSSTSSSGQFIVHGTDLQLRSAIASRCDEIDQELRQLLRDRQPWTLPVVIMLHPAAATAQSVPVRMTISEITHGGFHLQLDIALRLDLQPADLRAEVVRALLAERVLRLQKGSPKREQLLPQWMLTGVLEALDYRRNARPSALFAAIFKSGKVYGIEEIIDAQVEALDGLSRSIYRSSCCALVLALLDQPEGSSRLQRFLGSLAADARPLKTLLDEAFPSFATSPTSLNKWWALQLANLSRPGLSEPLSTAESLAAIEDALTLRYRAPASEIPAPAQLPPADEPSETKTAANAPESVAKNAQDPAATPSLAGRLFRWLNPFSRRANPNDQALQQAISQQQSSDSESDEGQPPSTTLPDEPANAERTKPSDEQRPWFNRWFRLKQRDGRAPAPQTNPAGKTEEKPQAMLNPWQQDWNPTQPMLALVRQSSAQPTTPPDSSPAKRRFRLFGGNDKPTNTAPAPAAAPTDAAKAKGETKTAANNNDNAKPGSAKKRSTSASRLPPSLLESANNKPSTPDSKAKPATNGTMPAAAASAPTTTAPATNAPDTTASPRKRGLFEGLFEPKRPANGTAPNAMPAETPETSTATAPTKTAPNNNDNAKPGSAKKRSTSASRLPPSLLESANNKPSTPDSKAKPATNGTMPAAAASAPTTTAPATNTPDTTASPRKRGLFEGLFEPKRPANGTAPNAMPAETPETSTATAPTKTAANNNDNAKPGSAKKRSTSASRLPPSLLESANNKPSTPDSKAKPATNGTMPAAAASAPTTTAPATNTPDTTASPRKRGLFEGLFEPKRPANGTAPNAMPAETPETSTATTPTKTAPNSKDKPSVRSGSKAKASTRSTNSSPEPKKPEPAPKPEPKKAEPMPAAAPKPLEPAPKPEPKKAEPMPAAAPKPLEPAPKPEPKKAEPMPTAAPKPLEPAPKPEPRKAEPMPAAAPKPLEPAPKPEPKKAEPMPAAAPKPLEPAPKPEPRKAEPMPAAAPKPSDPNEPLVDAALPIENFEAVLKRPDRLEIFKRCITALSVLQQRSAVLLRPIIGQYLIIVTELSEGKNRDAAKRLGELRKQLNQTAEQSRAIRDLLDVHEANSSPAMSGTFEDYLRLPQTIEQELPPRSDAISRYLDALDREFSKP